ncbi:MAG TPA: hypothetical protein VJV04_13805 [Nitrospiraceae bacterium]|nr:hypothetical protein [Nitrospiraceae bacterium]
MLKLLLVCALSILTFPPLSLANAGTAPAPNQSVTNGVADEKPITTEISIFPEQIAWIKIDYSDTLEFRALNQKLLVKSLNLDGSRRYADVLPFQSRHSQEEMNDLWKHGGKWQATYDMELRELLKDQYYMWREVHKLVEELEAFRGTRITPTYYKVVIGLKDQSMTAHYGEAQSYVEASAIVKDLRAGTIKSLIVSTPCDSCLIRAFGY